MKDYLVVIGQLILILLGIGALAFVFIGLPLMFGGKYAAIFYGIVIGGASLALMVSGVREMVADRRRERRWSERT